MAARLPKKITKRWLESQHACLEQVEFFEMNFPEGLEVSRGGLRRAIRAGLDVGWIYYYVPKRVLRQIESVGNEAFNRESRKGDGHFGIAVELSIKAEYRELGRYLELRRTRKG